VHFWVAAYVHEYIGTIVSKCTGWLRKLKSLFFILPRDVAVFTKNLRIKKYISLNGNIECVISCNCYYFYNCQCHCQSNFHIEQRIRIIKWYYPAKEGRSARTGCLTPRQQLATCCLQHFLLMLPVITKKCCKLMPCCKVALRVQDH
jgi:hypothetical protein